MPRVGLDDRWRPTPQETDVDINLLKAHRQNMDMLREVDPGERFAYAMYQAHCIGAGQPVQPWDLLTGQMRAGWIAAADFSEMYTRVLEIDAVVRAF
jgi:hypothetical protein